ncbi:hypothetical protein HYV84_04350 [Candidatus Woesearchaeota archaeon]|nr:hypothetical protein [Candidatus Woesearchaeota archaeon]
MPEIEIIAIGLTKIYSVGKIGIKSDGSVYHAFKLKNLEGIHTSRHRDGTLHWKSKQLKIPLRKGADIRDFSGLEFIGTQAFGLNSLPELYNEYKIKRMDGVFAIDMHNYKEGCFNLTIAIFTDEGVLQLFDSDKFAQKKKIYLYTDCYPRIALIAMEVKKD